MMGLFDKFKKEKTVNEPHRDRSISDVRVPAAPSPAPITPAVHVIKIYLKPYDNLDKIVQIFPFLILIFLRIKDRLS